MWIEILHPWPLLCETAEPSDGATETFSCSGEALPLQIMVFSNPFLQVPFCHQHHNGALQSIQLMWYRCTSIIPVFRVLGLGFLGELSNLWWWCRIWDDSHPSYLTTLLIGLPLRYGSVMWSDVTWYKCRLICDSATHHSQLKMALGWHWNHVTLFYASCMYCLKITCEKESIHVITKTVCITLCPWLLSPLIVLLMPAWPRIYAAMTK